VVSQTVKITDMMINIQQFINDLSPPKFHNFTKKLKFKSMQKTIFFFIIICFTIKGANSQTTKGNWLVGGSASYASTNYKSDAGSKSIGFVFNLSPNIGYFLADKFATGIKIGIGKSGYKAQGTSVSSIYTDFNVGPFVRYYLLSSDKQFNIITEGSYQYGFTADELRRLTTKNTFAFAAGPVVYFNSSVGLEFLVGYATYKNLGFSGSNSTVQVGLGLQVHLQRDK
jgi:hypothetical protein